MKSSDSRLPGRILLVAVISGATLVAAAAVHSVAVSGPPAPAGPAPAGRPTSKPAKPPKVDADVVFFTRGPIPRLRVKIAPKEMQALRANGRAYARASVYHRPTAVPAPAPAVAPAAAAAAPPLVAAGAAKGKPASVYGEVGVKLKGAAGSFRGIDDRPALTLNFDKFNKGQRFHGLDKVHLNNSVQDGTYLSEGLGAAVFIDAGVPAARATHAFVSVNDRDLGLYVLKEGFDGVFIKHFFKDESGTMYEGPFLGDIDQNLALKTNVDPKNPEPGRKKAAARLKELADSAREGDPAKRRERLEKVLDVDRFLSFLALEAMTAHWDGYGFNRNNYRIYDDAKTGKMVFLPHGMDQLFGNPGHPIMPGNGMVTQAVLATPEDKARYMERVAKLRETVFTPEKLTKHVDDATARLLPALEPLGPNAVQEQKNRAADMKNRALARIKEIDRQLGVTPKPLKFDKSGVAPLPVARWEPGAGVGNAGTDKVDEAGKPRLRVACRDGGGSGSWRTTVLLAQGRYVFEGRCRVNKVAAADGPNTGAGLRISGGTRAARLLGTGNWQKAEYEFEVAEPSREVVLVCELKANAGEASFDPESLRLRKK